MTDHNEAGRQPRRSRRNITAAATRSAHALAIGAACALAGACSHAVAAPPPPTAAASATTAAGSPSATAAASASTSPSSAPTATAGTTASATTAATAANPVPLLKKADATIPAGTVNGQEDLFGDRYADGTYSGGEQISAYTFATAAEQQADQRRNATPQDGHALVTGPLFDIWLTAVQDSSGAWVWQVSPQQVAARVGGTVTTP